MLSDEQQFDEGTFVKNVMKRNGEFKAASDLKCHCCAAALSQIVDLAAVRAFGECGPVVVHYQVAGLG